MPDTPQSLLKGGAEIAGLDNDGLPKCQEWTMQDWTLKNQMSWADIAGLDNDGPKWQGWTMQDWTMTDQLRRVLPNSVSLYLPTLLTSNVYKANSYTS